MIEALGKWIVTICIAIFFTTAVQMILPDNSLKKYCNFVLGLIVFVVMITPVIELFHSDVNVGKIIKESEEYVFNEGSDVDYKEYRQANINSTVEKFKENLEKQCVKDLKGNFKNDEFRANFQVSYDEKNSLFNIESIEVSINDGSVERIRDVKIGEEESLEVGSTDDELGQKGAEVKEYISARYDVDKSKINIFKASRED
ncbi:MAG: stage III sporulation protein AF [Clostridium sp.]|nr:stage III sporulation protein AF [Clostridium sp.]